ncbi:MAG: hypothetical protein ABSG57_14205 [Candidatus Bathyarchaeia archaeon]|jgi:hypothetical protein
MSLSSFTEALVGGWAREFASNNSKTTFFIVCNFDSKKFFNYESLEDHFKKEHMDKVTKFALSRGVAADVWNEALKRMTK